MKKPQVEFLEVMQDAGLPFVRSFALAAFLCFMVCVDWLLAGNSWQLLGYFVLGVAIGVGWGGLSVTRLWLEWTEGKE